jgi:hypothetical protein
MPSERPGNGVTWWQNDSRFLAAIGRLAVARLRLPAVAYQLKSAV